MKLHRYSYFGFGLLAAFALSVLIQGCASLTGSTDRDWQQLMTRNTELRGVSTQAASAGKLSKADFESAIKQNDAIRAELDKAKSASGASRTLAMSNARNQIGALEKFLQSKGVQVPPAGGEPAPLGKPQPKKEKQ